MFYLFDVLEILKRMSTETGSETMSFKDTSRIFYEPFKVSFHCILGSRSQIIMG